MNKKITIIGTIIAFLLCFFLHFLYERIPNIITSVIAPVNESIWEHMKILFTSIILSGIIEKIIILTKKLNIKNTMIANYVSGLLSIPIFLIMFLPIYKLIGENLVVNIILMLIALIISKVIAYYIMKRSDLKLEKLSLILILFTYVVFGILTYFPPKNELFIDPIDKKYGLKNR